MREDEAASVLLNWLLHPDPVEGTWKMIQCQDYEKYLEKIGTGPLSLNMVMRARVVVTISQV